VLILGKKVHFHVILFKPELEEAMEIQLVWKGLAKPIAQRAGCQLISLRRDVRELLK